jgi:thioredoxin 1
MKRNRIISVGVLVVTILVIISIYFIKNADKQINVTKGFPVATDFSTAGDKDLTSYALHAETIDLTAMKKEDVPILIDFGSSTCGPCIEMAPFLETIHEEMKTEAIVQYVDVEKYPMIVSEFPITVTPTQVLINADGSPYVPSEELGLEFLMYNSKETGEHAFTVHQGLLTVEQMRMILEDMGAVV